MIISIASGKGGTGKTTIASNMTAVINNSVYIDCDVEEPNGYLLLKPTITQEEPVFKHIPQFDLSKCDFCNVCSEACEFNALLNLKSEIYLIEELCHSCGACTYLCPRKAISEIQVEIGKLRVGEISCMKPAVTESHPLIKENEFHLFIDGSLKIGEASGVPLIKSVKHKLNTIDFNSDFNKSFDKLNIIIDSPPGTSCSMVESVNQSDFCILVTESTPFGLSDLNLAVEVLDQLKIPFGIVINKYDENYTETERFIKEKNLNLLITIPFDLEFAEIYSRGELLSSISMDYRKIMINIFNRVKEIVSDKSENHESKSHKDYKIDKQK